MRLFTLIAAFALISCAQAPAQPPGPAIYGYEVVKTYPHDPGAFTQGLVYLDGFLYEGTGQNGRSSIRKVELSTGKVLQKQDIPQQFFGEGIVNWKDRLIQLTWQNEQGFVWDLATFQPKAVWRYPGEGWGLTQDGQRIIMSDGSAQLRFLDPETLTQTGTIGVVDEGRPVDQLNELEFIKGEVWANVWQTDTIVRINPANGQVTGRIDLSGLLSPADRIGHDPDVLNGIAYDPAGDRIFVTGKQWPKIYEIKLVERARR